MAEKAQVLTRWMDEGRIARVDPVHLIFSIWALTQHYADFDVQVRAVLGPGHDPFAEAGQFPGNAVFGRLLTPLDRLSHFNDMPVDAKPSEALGMGF